MCSVHVFSTRVRFNVRSAALDPEKIYKFHAVMYSMTLINCIMFGV